MTIIFFDTESRKEYNLTFKEDVAQLRSDLKEKGFFEVDDNKKYYEWFDRNITASEFEDFLGAVRFYNRLLIKKRTKKVEGGSN